MLLQRYRILTFLELNYLNLISLNVFMYLPTRPQEWVVLSAGAAEYVDSTSAEG